MATQDPISGKWTTSCGRDGFETLEQAKKYERKHGGGSFEDCLDGAIDATIGYVNRVACRSFQSFSEASPNKDE